MDVNNVNVTETNQDRLPTNQLELATIAGGCFWCTEAVYQNIKGVESVVSGYAGDTKETANYKDVSSGRTRHAEAIQVTFDPNVISYAEIIEMFWTAHDPTTLNRQGNDIGPQYRSAIFYHNMEQKAIADKSKQEVATQIWDQPIVTEIAPLEAFYVAEDYHQNYYNNTGDRNPYCTFVITPKVVKFKKMFKDRLNTAGQP